MDGSDLITNGLTDLFYKDKFDFNTNPIRNMMWILDFIFITLPSFSHSKRPFKQSFAGLSLILFSRFGMRFYYNNEV
jgi:hypothetical protein